MESLRKGSKRLEGDEPILEESEFVLGALKAADEKAGGAKNFGRSDMI